MNRKLQQILFFAFAVVYGLAIRIRNSLFDSGMLKSTSFDLPVISAGNLTVGGTGKTPHIEYLVRLLKDQYNISVLSRGYKRETRNFQFVETDSTVPDTGDESLQLKRKHPEITVAVDRDRVKGVKQILARKPETDIILLDDAFQHRYIKPGLNILLIDYNRPIYRDYLLPAGRLRESRSSVKRADIVILSKAPDYLSSEELEQLKEKIKLSPEQKFFCTGIKYDHPREIFNTDKKENIEKLADKMGKALLVTGIADPSPLIKYLNGFGFQLNNLRYRDHHNYNDRDCKRIIESYVSLPKGERCLLTTEKDAIRLVDKLRENDLPDSNFFMIGININLMHNAKEDFDKYILDYVKNNRRNGNLS